MNWQLQDAKNRFSQIVRDAQTQGPQFVTVRGARAAVVLSAADYAKLQSGRSSLVDTLLAGPAWDDEFVDAVNSRSKTPSRAAAF